VKLTTSLFLDVGERVSTLSMKQDRLLCTAALRLNVPPSFDHYLEWGFFDGSVRFYAADSRKVWIPPERHSGTRLTIHSCLATSNTFISGSSHMPALPIHAPSSPVAWTAQFPYGQSQQAPGPLTCSPSDHCLVIAPRSTHLLSRGLSAPCFLRPVTARSCYGI